jgi:MarR family transcriptional regulator, transcriptional regulator for hemolysin
MDSLRHFGFLLKDVSRLYSRDFERHAAGLRLTLEPGEHPALLERSEGISQARLAELTDTNPMTLGRLLARMEKDRLVTRRPDPADRRAQKLYLAKASAPLLKKIGRLAESTREDALAALPERDRERLVELLQHLHANLEALVPATPERPGAGRAKPASR